MDRRALWTITLGVMWCSPFACAPEQAAESGEINSRDPTYVVELNQAVGCLNQSAHRVVDSHNRYLAWAGKEGTGRCGTAGSADAIVPLGSEALDTCQTALQGAQATPTLSKIDQGLAKYVASCKAADVELRVAQTYYMLQNYLDDECEEGRRLHAVLVERLAAVVSTEKVLRASLEEAVGASAKSALERLGASADGGLETNVRRQLARSREVLKAFEGVRDGLSAEDLASLERQVDSFGEAVLAGRQFAERDPAEAKRARTQGTLDASWSLFVQAKRSARALRASWPTARGAVFDADSHDRLVKRYNAFIAATHSLRI